MLSIMVLFGPVFLGLLFAAFRLYNSHPSRVTLSAVGVTVLGMSAWLRIMYVLLFTGV